MWHALESLLALIFQMQCFFLLKMTIQQTFYRHSTYVNNGTFLKVVDPSRHRRRVRQIWKDRQWHI